LKLGHPAPPGQSYSSTADEFVKEVEELTDGNVKIEVFDSSQLGGQRELVEQVQTGTLDLALVSMSPVANFVEEIAVLDLPFLFDSLDHVYSALDGELGAAFSEKMETVGLKSLGFMELGFKNVSNSKHHIYNADDFEGLKLKVAES